jgi:hypothetical protein
MRRPLLAGSFEILDHLISLPVILHHLNRRPDPVAQVEVREMELLVLAFQDAWHARRSQFRGCLVPVRNQERDVMDSRTRRFQKLAINVVADKVGPFMSSNRQEVSDGAGS